MRQKPRVPWNLIDTRGANASAPFSGFFLRMVGNHGITGRRLLEDTSTTATAYNGTILLGMVDNP